jgi:hypothetical protein
MKQSALRRIMRTSSNTDSESGRHRADTPVPQTESDHGVVGDAEGRGEIERDGRGRPMDRRGFLKSGAVGVAAWLLAPRPSWGGPVTSDAIGDRVQTLPKGQLPDFAGSNVPDTRRLYAYAVEHGDELQYIPCTCGCVRLGHQSNRDCYIKSFNKDGTLTFTSHAAT